MDKDLTQKLRTRLNSFSRVRGRYYVSDLYYIVNGLMTPEEWLKPKQKDIEGLVKILSLQGMHDKVVGLIKGDFKEEKAESVYEGITLVGRCDLLNVEKSEVWSLQVDAGEIKPWTEYQLRLYCSMFSRDVGLLYQPVSDKNGLYLKNLLKVEKDDDWFGEQVKKLYTFHLEVEKLWEGISKTKLY